MPFDSRELLQVSEETIQTKSMPGGRIDILPDDVLLGLFDFHMITNPFLFEFKSEVEVWQPLVHVCRRWRSLIFQSSRRLNLRLYCSPKTPARDTLDVWPALPLIVQGNMGLSGTRTDNIIAALGQHNRIHDVHLWGLSDRQLEQVLDAMQVPFPELTNLRLYSKLETIMLVIPDSCLGGSAPRLQTFSLSNVPFTGLPRLLFSIDHFVDLELLNIPYSGYISPETMVALLAVLRSLERFEIQFQSPRPHPDLQNRRPSLSKRSTLPALDKFSFKGVTEYLEEFVTRIDAPRLRFMSISFFNQIDFDCPRLAQFISRTSSLKTLIDAHVRFDISNASVNLGRRKEFNLGNLHITISCKEPDWQLSSIEQVCNFSFPLVSTIEDLYIDRGYGGYGGHDGPLVWKNDAIEDALWWQLLLPFIAVKNLYLSREFASFIAVALRELDGGGVTVVLPSLQNILVEGLEPSGPLQENVGHFVAARRNLSNRPITISVWTKTEDSNVMPT